MTHGPGSPSRLAGLYALTVLIAACVVAPGAAASSTPSGDGNLSPRLAELAKPSLRSAPAAKVAERLSLAPSGPGSLVREGARVLVEVRFESGAAAAVPALRAAGARIVDVSRRYQTATVAAEPAELPGIGELARVAGVTEVLAPLVRAADCGGAVTSEGDAQLNANLARANFGLNGAGVTVGILSDSFDRNGGAETNASQDVASGDLPGPGSPCGSSTPVNVIDDSDAAGEDEGRAMAQIVHDLAPGANLAFASASGGESQFAFASNIEALFQAGARVIADDILYFEEPFFQDGPVAVAADEVTAVGASYFSAAGNDNVLFNGKDIGSWEGTFHGTGNCPAFIPKGPTDQYNCTDFNGAGDTEFAITVRKEGSLSLDLQWAEPWFGVNTDLDAFLVNGTNTVVKKSDEDNVGTSQTPFEFLSWENPTNTNQVVRLVVKRFSGSASPVLKLAMLENGAKDVLGSDYEDSTATTTVGPTILGHSGAASVISVAAVPFDNSSEPEYYSSRGPVKHFFGPVLDTSPAPQLGSPQVLQKPDLAATDCGVTTFFAFLEGSDWRFCGTSAAAPHAAAVAALLRQASPGASASAVRTDLISTARPVGTFGPEAVGGGLIDAAAAVQALALPPKITVTQAPPALSRNRRPTFQFTANRPVSFHCAVDGGAAQPCASPFTVPVSLEDGNHGFLVTGVDLAGREGSSGVVSFAIDTQPPRTSFSKHPPKRIRTHRRAVRETFRFHSNETGVKFACKVDRGLPRFCGARISRLFAAGKHVVQVRAEDAAGNVDPTPAVSRFRVKRVG